MEYSHGPWGSMAWVGRLLFFLFMWVPMIVGWIILLVAAWRAMRAHESIAASLRRMAEPAPPPPPPPAT